MKNMKRIFSLVLALVMMMALTVAAGATATATNLVNEVVYKGDDAVEGSSLTVSNAVSGETYEIYQLFKAELNADGSGVIYPSTQAIPNELTAYFEVDKDHPNTIKAKFTEFNEDILKVMKEWAGKQTAMLSGKSDGTALAFKNIPYGYYVVVSRASNGGSISVDSNRPNVVLIDKNEGGNDPKFPEGEGKKVTKITKADGTVLTGNDLTTANKSVSVGDLVEYTVKYDTKNFVPKTAGGPATEQVKEYVLTDVKPAFLEKFTVTSVTINGEEYKVDNAVPQFNDEGKMTFEWAVKTDKLICTNEDHTKPGGQHGDTCYQWNSKYANGAQIVITYNAYVNENVIDNADAKNEVSAHYTTVAGAGKDGTDKPTETIKSYNFDLVKTAGQTSTILSGAKFELYDAKTDGDKINLVKVNDTTYRVATKAEAEVAGFKSAEIVTIADSKIVIKGLGNGSYWLEETEAPTGYNKLKDRHEVKIENNNNGSTLNTTTNLYEGGAVVENLSGAELPATGGIGTTIFTVTGGLLMIGAAILFLTKKRSEG